MARCSTLYRSATAAAVAFCVVGAGIASAQGDPLGDVSAVLAGVANAPEIRTAGQAASPSNDPAQPVVRAVLFTRVGCEHCYEVKHDVLPPIQEMFGDRLDLRALYSDTEPGHTLYEIAVVTFEIEDPGVPLLIVGDQVFKGTSAIRDLFPLAVQGYLERGGVTWPDMPGLEYAIAEAGAAGADAPAASADAVAGPSLESTATLESSPTATPAPSATLAPTATPMPPPTPSPTPASRFGGCFGSIALGALAAGAVVVRRRDAGPPPR